MKKTMLEKVSDILKRRIERFLVRIQNDLYEDSLVLDADYALSKDPVKFADRLTLSYKTIKEGEVWGKTWENAWFHLKGTVPAKWKNKEVVLLLQLSGEALLVDKNGVPCCGFSGGSVFAPSYQKNRFFFCTAKGEEKADFWVEACASYLAGLWFDRDPVLDTECPKGNMSATAKKMRLAVFRRNVWQLFLDVTALNDVLTTLPAEDYRRNKIIHTLNEALSLYHDNPDNAEKCRDVLKEMLSYPAIKSTLTAYAVGHAHIDVGWLWQVKESIRKAARTFASQLRLMEEYPDYVFGASQAQLYSFVKEHYPELFDEIKKRVREGRWEIQGGMWVEADGNLISGESMVRQFLHGKNFFMDEFGFDVKNLWLPDVFGYSAAMPQIIKKSGCDYFLTQKLSWSQINTFPHNTFLWQGIDGSSVLTHFPPENNYTSKLAPSLLMAAQNRFKENGFLDHFLSLFGVGDGGGGPSDEMLEMGNREKDWEFTPKVKFSRADHFFEKLSKDIGKLEKWTGELYLEYHRGTLTSQARTKRGNRKCEQMLAATEFILSHLPLKKYPHKELDQCWKTLLLNQFHDIIPGSSISEVYEQTEKDHTCILEKCRQLLINNAKNLFKKEKDALLLVNTLSSSYEKCIELPASWLDHCVTDENGEIIKVQKEKDKLIASVNLPGNSFTTLYKGQKKKEKDCFISGKDENSLVLENDLIRYEFTMDGTLKSAFDKEEKRELLSSPGNILSLYHDHPNSYEAWDIDLYYPQELVEVLKAKQVRKITEGKLRSILELTFSTEDSFIKQKVILESNSKKLDFVTEVDWYEARKMLRTAFPVDILANEAQYDIQYGFVKRSTADNTSWDIARFEACGHKYADLSSDRYGVALLNDCKYGYKIKGNVLDLALLRSPKSPDFEADQGKQFFTYCFYPHKGNAVNSSVMQESAAVNREPIQFQGYARGGKLPLCKIQSENGGVSLEVLKKAEKEDALVIRVVETKGEHSTGELVFSSEDFLALETTSLMEWEKGEKIPVRKGKATLSLAPFEIRTFFLRKG